MKIIDKYINANGGDREELLNNYCVEDKIPSAKVICNEDCHGCWNKEYIKQETISLHPMKDKPNYVMHTLEKHTCFGCERDFIISEYYAQDNDIKCPYCHGDKTELMVRMGTAEQLEKLGYIGIVHARITA